MKRKNRHDTLHTRKRRRPKAWISFAGVILLTAGFVVWKTAWQTRTPKDSEKEAAISGASTIRPQDEVFAAYAGSASCAECHSVQFDDWKKSNHGLAERNVDFNLDQDAFDPAQSIKHGTETSEARHANGKLELETRGKSGSKELFAMERVIGVDPLKQFLVAEKGGRYQVTEFAVDPRNDTPEWFDIFGDENRQPGEWGHWTGRGMNWNNMCAACHNTRVRKNYQHTSDSYATAMAEMSVGCEACHGPMAEHVSWRRENRAYRGPDATVPEFAKDRLLATCGSCHSRRSELTGDFRPGERFEDHHLLTIPDESDLFYPDGQVRDEDYEFTSFLSSRMHLAGVSCMDCHNPHTGKTLLPGNLLCMRCHEQPVAPAPKIDIASHMHHSPNEPGGRCIDCHMPQTVYMQRHWRHDHGFTIPDPLLTLEHGIPNACNRCHTEKSVDWAIAAANQWYGDRLDHPTRRRTRWIAEARNGKPGAQQNLLQILKEEPIPLWRAVAANLLKRWVADLVVREALLQSTSDTNAMVRGMSARALELLPRHQFSGVEAALNNLLNDPARSVRTEAAWAQRSDISTSERAARELLEFMNLNRDQPSGLLQFGQWHLDRGEIEPALEQFRRSVEWDPGSGVLRHALAVALSMVGNTAGAVVELEAASRLVPTDAEFRFKLGLAYNEIGKLADAIESLKEAVRLDPQYPQASYNLGLAYSAAGQPEAALQTLSKAESVDSASARIPYARATILMSLGRLEEAAAAASRALELEPSFSEAANLLRMTSQSRRPGP
ncbi:MAG: tetratricopeptide repeat protein [Verrucomicrobia bacterium]|nr:tetratricopeptide repeat protein [Verrucomicrobiota bacterium]